MILNDFIWCCVIECSIYVEAVINHMAGDGSGNGSGGSYYNSDTLEFPGVPYGPDDFNNQTDCSSSDGDIQASIPTFDIIKDWLHLEFKLSL
jgi:hypothetical protein